MFLTRVSLILLALGSFALAVSFSSADSISSPNPIPVQGLQGEPIVPAGAEGIDDCSFCGGDGVFGCLRCKGKGNRSVPCGRCGGKYRVECPAIGCSGGKAVCQACGGDGYIQWSSGATDPCKVCAKKGRLKCGFCAGKAKVDCPKCKRKGKLNQVCEACLGAGHHPCPRCRPDDGCGVCDGKGLPCLQCAGTSRIEHACETCYDYGVRFCDVKLCVSGERICKECSGAGVVRKVFTESGTAAGASKCTACKGKGKSRCRECKNGVLPCKLPRPTERCEVCREGRVVCPRCRAGR